MRFAKRNEFLSLVHELAAPGELQHPQTFDFNFQNVEKQYESYNGINVKLQKSGGLLTARRMIERARSLGLKVLLGCMIETSLGITAAAHLSPLADFADLDGHLLIEDDPFRGVVIREGRLVLPDRPGLGILGTW